MMYVIIVVVAVMFIVPSVLIACKFGIKELLPFWIGFMKGE